MNDAWTRVSFSAQGAIAALAQISSPVIEAHMRTRLESARGLLRQGEFADGMSTLENMIEQLAPDDETSEPPGPFRLAIGLAQSVLAQGFDQAGIPEEAEPHYRTAVELFRGLAPGLANARDKGDFGAALVALNEDEEGVRLLGESHAAGAATPEACRQLAKALLRAGDVVRGEQLLRETLLAAPADPDALVMLGSVLADRGDGEAASTLASAVYSLMQRGRYRQALETLDQLEGAGAANSALAGVRAEALRLGDEPASAVAEYELALVDAPDQVWLLAGATEALYRLDRYDDALEFAVRGLALQEQADLLLIAGDAARLRGDFDRAREFAGRARLAAPGMASAHFLEALVAHAQADEAAALDAIKAARLLDPDRRDLQILHGDLEMANGSIAVAAEIYLQVCGSEGATARDNAQLVRLLRLNQEVPRALSHGRRAIERYGDDPTLLVEVAEVLLANDDPTSALELLARIAAEDADTFEVHWLAAQALTEAKDAEAAREHVRRLLEMDPNNPQTHIAAGFLESAMGKQDEAQSAFRRALELDPSSPKALLALAELVADRDPSEVVALLDTVLNQELDDESLVRALQSRGVALLDLGKHELGLDDLRRAYEIAPESASVQRDLAEATRLSGDPLGALDLAEAALRRDPTSAQGYAVRAGALRALGRTPEAVEDLLEATRVDATYRFAWVQLAQLERDPTQAQAYLERAAELDPDDRAVALERAALLSRSENYEEALTAYRELLQTGHEDEALAGEIDALRFLQRREEAVAAAERALRESDGSFLVQRSTALAMVEAGQRAKGIELLRLIVRDRPSGNSLSDLAWALFLDEQLEEAGVCFGRALAEDPDDVWTLNEACSYHIHVGDFPRAVELAERSLALVEGQPELWGRLGWACAYLEPPELERSLAALERSLALDAENDAVSEPDVSVLITRGDIRAALGRTDARRDFEQALDLARRKVAEGSTWYLSHVGWCQFRLDDLRGAARTFLEARSVDERPGSDAFDLALVTMCRGQHAIAREMYAEILELIRSRNDLRARGLIRIALADLRNAVRDFPNLAKAAEYEASMLMLSNDPRNTG